MWQLIALWVLARMVAGDRDSSVEALAGERISYRTKDGAADYSFSIEQRRDRSWRVYILAQPSHPSRTSRFHVLTAADGRRFICWSRNIADREDARLVAASWAESTQRYLRTGQGF